VTVQHKHTAVREYVSPAIIAALTLARQRADREAQEAAIYADLRKRTFGAAKRFGRDTLIERAVRFLRAARPALTADDLTKLTATVAARLEIPKPAWACIWPENNGESK
jgi:hypothetical protein